MCNPRHYQRRAIRNEKEMKFKLLRRMCDTVTEEEAEAIRIYLLTEVVQLLIDFVHLLFHLNLHQRIQSILSAIRIIHAINLKLELLCPNRNHRKHGSVIQMQEFSSDLLLCH